MYGEEVTKAIKEDAISRFPHESCGLILRAEEGRFTYLAADNLSSSPTDEFHIDERLVLANIGRLVAIVHSHPNGPDCPSEADMRQQRAYGVPFGIVSTDGVGCYEPFFWGDSVPRAPLLGRPFRHGVTDCYGLVRDYYDEKCGIKLRDYPREWGWWENGQSLYEDFLAHEGFFRIEASDVREHDGFLAQINSKTPNHAGVYVGGNMILHHLSSRKPYDPSRISRRDPVGAWSKFICGFWVRHRSLA